MRTDRIVEFGFTGIMSVEMEVPLATVNLGCGTRSNLTPIGFTEGDIEVLAFDA